MLIRFTVPALFSMHFVVAFDNYYRQLYLSLLSVLMRRQSCVEAYVEDAQGVKCCVAAETILC